MVTYGKFELPEEIKVEEAGATFARFILEPFERGYGHTVGNCLRRVILTSLEAPALIGVRIDGIAHEYMAIEGVVEDMVNIVLNFKRALLRRLPGREARPREDRIGSKTVEVTEAQLREGNGQYGVTLGDVFEIGQFEMVNPELHLFTVTKPATFRVDCRVGVGRGYVPSERLDVPDRFIDEIVLDGLFSPVRNVNYRVEATRVGQHTDFDKLILEVTTDGRVSPQEAVGFAAGIATKHFEVFRSIQKGELKFERQEVIGDSDRRALLQKLALGIGEVELSVRSTNCLKTAGIHYMGELVIMREQEMLQFRNFGKKSLGEIREKLNEHELRFGMDLVDYGIDRENVRTVIEEYLAERQAALGVGE